MKKYWILSSPFPSLRPSDRSTDRQSHTCLSHLFFFLWTVDQSVLKFDTKLYVSIVNCAVHFHICRSTIACLPIFFHIMTILICSFCEHSLPCDPFSHPLLTNFLFTISYSGVSFMSKGSKFNFFNIPMVQLKRITSSYFYVLCFNGSRTTHKHLISEISRNMSYNQWI